MVLLAAFVVGAALLQSPTVETDAGLHTVTFDTLYGNVVVALPDDMRATDTISGTVLVEPRGKDAAERAKNATALSGFVVEGAGSRTSSGQFKWAVPAALIASMPLVLKDARGRTVGRAAAIPLDSANTPTPSAFQAPPFAQSGRPLVCVGPFDGDFLTTSASVGGAPADELAESPRQVVLRSMGATGAGEIQIQEGDKRFAAPMQSLLVRLTAPTQTLLQNQTTDVKCVVSGFDAAPDNLFPVPFELQCLTPATAQLQGIPGGFVAHSINKQDIVNGTYTYSVGLIGTRAGAYSVTARVLWLWPWSKKKENPLLKKPPCPETSPFFKCCWLITVGPGKGVADVDHSAVSIDGKVYSFEGGGMVVYPNTGAYLNKRKFEDGRQVWVNPVSGVDKDAMRKKAQEIIDAKKPYDLFGNNCALNAAGLLEAGGVKDLLKEVKPLRLQKRNEDLGAIGKKEEIKDKQVE